jgi:hypothetical protein
LDVQAAPRMSLHRGSISGTLQPAPVAQEAAPRSLFAATEKERLLIVNSLTKAHTPSGKHDSLLKHAVIAPDVVMFNFANNKRFLPLLILYLPLEFILVHPLIHFSFGF